MTFLSLSPSFSSPYFLSFLNRHVSIHSHMICYVWWRPKVWVHLVCIWPPVLWAERNLYFRSIQWQALHCNNVRLTNTLKNVYLPEKGKNWKSINLRKLESKNSQSHIPPKWLFFVVPKTNDWLLCLMPSGKQFHGLLLRAHISFQENSADLL